MLLSVFKGIFVDKYKRLNCRVSGRIISISGIRRDIKKIAGYPAISDIRPNPNFRHNLKLHIDISQDDFSLKILQTTWWNTKSNISFMNLVLINEKKIGSLNLSSYAFRGTLLYGRNNSCFKSDDYT